MDLGNTQVTITGSNFKHSHDLKCNFGPYAVAAEYVNSGEIKCTAPRYKLKTSESGKRVSFWISGGGEISSSKDFLYYATLLASDLASNSVKAFDLHHGRFKREIIAPGSGGLTSPQGIAIGSDDRIYVASANDKILKYSANGLSEGVFAELPKNCGPKDILFGPDTNLFVACSLLNRVIALNANSGQMLGIAAQGGGLSQPHGIAFGPGNTLYVVSGGNHKLLRYAQGGYFQGAVAKLGDANKDVNFYNGRIFLSGGASHSHSVLVFENGRLTQHAAHLNLHQPSGIHFDSGKLYVASRGHIVRFSDKGEFQVELKTGRNSHLEVSFMTSSAREVARRGRGPGGRHDEL